MNENYDKFPVNLREMDGAIKREPFLFKYRKVNVWQDGMTIYSEEYDSDQIVGKLEGNILNVTIDNPRLRPFIKKDFTFSEISTNIDRILWSNDLLNKNSATEWGIPKISSLYFKNGVLVKVAFHLGGLLIEFF